jgi:hypothetical protein
VRRPRQSPVNQYVISLLLFGSIELDFDSEEGQRIVRKLPARSDVVLENFKVGSLAKFGSTTRARV